MGKYFYKSSILMLLFCMMNIFIIAIYTYVANEEFNNAENMSKEIPFKDL